jgi:Fe2+ or Zn2+ uptake regulation protein
MHSDVNNVYEDIRSQGKKLTKTRKAVIEMLVSSHNLLTAIEIQEQLNSLGIQEVTIKPGVTHYESALLPHHHHITCKSCGEIKDIDTKELDVSIQTLEKKIASQGFSVSEHSLEFYGLCSKCE